MLNNNMRKEYDFSKAKGNPYTERLKKTPSIHEKMKDNRIPRIKTIEPRADYKHGTMILLK